MKISKNLIPFLDVLFTFLMVFICITMLLKAKSDNESASYKQQNAIYLIVLNWIGNADIDLWTKDGAGHHVGFSNREGGNGSLISLNRDCLGAATSEVGAAGYGTNYENFIPVQAPPPNEEIISVRGVEDGEYIVNSHAYALKDGGPTKATVKLIKNKPYKIIIEKEYTFNSTGEEHTFFRFTLDKDGNIIDLNELPTNLIGSGK